MRTISGFCLFMSLLIAGGCGDDADDNNLFTPPKDDIIVDGSGVDIDGDINVIRGPIEDFGSIIIDGKRYLTDDAAFTVKGESENQSALAKGDYISLYYTQSADGSELVATQVIYEPPLAGEISQVDADAQTLTVLAQTVSITPETRTGSNGETALLERFQAGDFVEISGFIKGERSLSATRIASNVESITAISGQIAITSDNIATIRGVLIDRSLAEIPATIQNGDQVSVSGDYDSDNNTLIATEYRAIPAGPELAEDALLTVDGLISEVVDPVIRIGDVRPKITENTVIVGGTRDDIKVGARVLIVYPNAPEAHPEIQSLTIKSPAP